MEWPCIEDPLERKRRGRGADAPGLRSILVPLALLLVSGCAASGPVAGESPVVTTMGGQFMGSPLSGPRDLPPPDDLSLYRVVHVIHRMEVDGLDADLVREASGRWPLFEVFDSSPSAPAEERDGLFGPPFRADAIRLHDLLVHFRDETVSPPLEADVALVVGLTDFGSDDPGARLELTLSARPLIGLLDLRGPVAFTEGRLSASLDICVSDLDPAPLADHLESLGLKALAGRFDATFGTRFLLREPKPGDLTADLALSPLAISVDGTEALRVSTLSVVDLNLAAAAPTLSRLEFDGLTADSFPAFDEVVIHDLRFDLLLADSRPPLPLRIEDARFRRLEPDTDARPIELYVTASVPGILERLTLGGRIDPSRRELAVEIQARGVGLTSLESRLPVAGIRPQFDRATLTLDLEGKLSPKGGSRFEADLSIRDLSLVAEEELCRIPVLTVVGADLDPESDRYRVERIEIEGPELAARLDPDGSVSVAGIRFPPAAGGGPRPAGVANPRIEVGALRLSDAKLGFTDAGLEPPLVFLTTETHLDLHDLALGGETDATPVEGSLAFRTDLVDLLERLEIDGKLVAGGRRREIDVAVRGTGFRGDLLARILEPEGVECEISSGDLEFKAHVGLKMAEEGFDGSAELGGLRFRDRDVDLVSIDRVKIAGFSRRPDSLRAAAVSIEKPYLRIERGPDRRLGALGLRFPSPGREAAPVKGPGGAAPAANPSLALTSLRLSGARLAWTDRMIDPPLEVTVTASGALDDLGFADGTISSTFAFELAAEDSRPAVSASGKAALSEADSNLEITLDARGLGTTFLDPYLAGGVDAGFDEGRLRFKATARLGDATDGGRKGELVVEDFALDDLVRNASPCRFARARLGVSRSDPDRHILEIEEVSVSGLDIRLRRDESGDLILMGQRLSAKAGAAAPVPSPVPLSADEITAGLQRALEADPLLVRIATFDLDLVRLAVIDELRPDADPLLIESFRAKSLGPIQLFGPDPGLLPPGRFSITGSAPSLVRSVSAEFEMVPFGAEPWATISFELIGIHEPGRGIAGLPPNVDLTRLEDGSLRAKLRAALRLERNMGGGLDLESGFAAEVVLSDLLLADAEGKALLALDSIYAKARRLDPRTVHLETLDIISPKLEVERTGEGLRVAGVLLERRDADLAPGVLIRAAVDTPGHAAGPTEFAVDTLRIADLDMTYHGSTWEPAVVLPISGLDLEVSGLSSRAFSEPISISFEMSSGSQKIELPLKGNSEREAFELISAKGRLALFPDPLGWIEAEIRGLELSNFRGPGQRDGFTLNDGLLDLTLKQTFSEGDLVHVAIRARMWDLDLTEPADGPIRRLLRLPVSLNTVLYALRDSSGTISVPLDFTLKDGKLGPGEMASQATEAFGALTAKALATSPLSFAGAGLDILKSAGDLVGGGRSPHEEIPPIHLPFGTGDTRLGREGIGALEEVVRKLDEDGSLIAIVETRFGQGDVDLCRSRMNPSPEDARELAAGLRQRVSELLQRRALARLSVQAAMATGSEPRFEAMRTELRMIDRALGLTGEALGEILDSLRPGSGIRADLRTRAACVDLGSRRLDEVKRRLSTLASEDVLGRIRFRRSLYSDPVTKEGGTVTLTLERLRD